MNEVLQVLMYFFEKIGDELPSIPTEHEHSIMAELRQLGIPVENIQRLHAWMGDIMGIEKRIEEYPLQAPMGTRVFHQIEASRISKKCWTLLLHLEQKGILNPITRELVLDQLLQIHPRDITPPRIKWITLMILGEQTDKLSAAYMERFLLKDSSYHLH